MRDFYQKDSELNRKIQQTINKIKNKNARETLSQAFDDVEQCFHENFKATIELCDFHFPWKKRKIQERENKSWEYVNNLLKDLKIAPAKEKKLFFTDELAELLEKKMALFIDMREAEADKYVYMKTKSGLL